MKRIVIIVCFLISAVVFAFSQHVSLEKRIDSIVSGKKATVGVAVVFDGKDTLVLNNQCRYPTMSTYKFHQALAVLNYLDQHQLPLNTELYIRKSDLLPDTYSPLRDLYPKGEFYLSVGELLKYSVAQSDNNVCDILFRYIGGVEVVDQYIRKLGLTDMKLAATEEQMHEAFENQYLNWMTPLAAVRLLEIFQNEPLYANPAYKEFLEEVMIETNTGSNKIKSGLPGHVVFGHKTGSAGRNAAGLKPGDNDMGFVHMPDGRRYSIVVLVMNSREDDDANAALIAEISKAVYDYYISHLSK